ncbi:MAG: hypothetical protein GC187_09875 [Alphaproteobacteria bacterium]|nr:hypothetical protein [Alphaproteobacteria bacterium]
MIRYSALSLAAMAIAAAGLAATGAGAPASAQALGQGDFALCAVYRPDGTFAGYSNACLERQRAAIRRFSQPSPSHGGHARAAGVYPCPSWANQGYGFSSTSSGFGGRVQYGTFTSSVNGQPCIPSPNIVRRGLP